MAAQSGSPQVSFDSTIFGPFGSAFKAFSDMTNPEVTGAALNGLNPTAMMQQATAATKGLARVQLEAAGFAVRRMQAYMQVPAELARCRTPRDLADVQMNFWRTAMEQYIGSSHRMMEAWTGMVPAMCALGAVDRRPGSERERDYISFGTTPGTKEANGHDQTATPPAGARRVA